MKFNPGQIVATCGVNAELDDERFADFVRTCLPRHLKGDWGDMCDEDKEENELSLKEGYRVMSSYECPFDATKKIWIITEADRSVTTILFPEEY